MHQLCTLHRSCFSQNIGNKHLQYSFHKHITPKPECISLITVWKVCIFFPLWSVFSLLKVLNCIFFPPSLQVHSPRALRGSRSAVLHQNLCQVQEKHRGASNWSFYQSARLDQRCSTGLRMRASRLLMKLKQLNLLLSIANYQDKPGLKTQTASFAWPFWFSAVPFFPLLACFPSILLSLIVVSLVPLYTSCFSAPCFFSHFFPSLYAVSPSLRR